jgi:hypothetical protein
VGRGKRPVLRGSSDANNVLSDEVLGFGWYSCDACITMYVPQLARLFNALKRGCSHTNLEPLNARMAYSSPRA